MACIGSGWIRSTQRLLLASRSVPSERSGPVETRAPARAVEAIRPWSAWDHQPRRSENALRIADVLPLRRFETVVAFHGRLEGCCSSPGPGHEETDSKAIERLGA